MFFVRFHFGHPNAPKQFPDEVKTFEKYSEYEEYVKHLETKEWRLINWRWYSSRNDVEVWFDYKIPITSYPSSSQYTTPSSVVPPSLS
jgi:hypothetical protein